MKKNIATLPLIEAFRADDECPFCYLERAQAKSFSLFKQCAKLFIFAVQVKKSIQVAVINLINIITDMPPSLQNDV